MLFPTININFSITKKDHRLHKDEPSINDIAQRDFIQAIFFFAPATNTHTTTLFPHQSNPNNEVILPK